MERKSISIDVAGKTLTFETGKVAKQANGAVIAKMGDTMVFTSACASKEALTGVDFLPLRVDYQEKFSSTGKTVSGFIKREGKPSEKSILTCRLIDRCLRPLFPEGYYHELQVLSYVWSYDGTNSPDPLAICGASAALAISDIPLIKPIAAVRLGFVEGEFIVNPTQQELLESKSDIIIAGSEEAILMIEGECDFLTEEQIIEAIALGHVEIQKICRAIIDWREEVGKEKNESTLYTISEKTQALVEEKTQALLADAIKIQNKKEREESFKTAKEKIVEELCPEGNEEEHALSDINKVFKSTSAQMMRSMILDQKVRCDGRGLEDIRFIDIEQGFLPMPHGSSLFTRGETQTMAVCTLGGDHSAQRFETLDEDGSQRFYLQYFFPPFCVGEVGRVGPAARREVGHGKLAERALQTVIPSKEDFPYTIRLESNITESNGSSSMASVCGGCLSMMDAGVPIERPVSGIAMGLILEGERYAVLSDILGIEDALGDMDFKVTGDAKGITALQMDIKVEGITVDIMRAALIQAKNGRIHILNKMLSVCPASSGEVSDRAPRIESIQVPVKKIGVVIGPGGKQIRAIIEKSNAELDIGDDGVVNIVAKNAHDLGIAKEMIEGLIAEVEKGKIYTGTVVSVVPFGLFLEVLPGKEGLCHISELSEERVEDINSFAKQGDIMEVKVLDINDRGQIKLSRKAVLKAGV